MLKRAFDPDNWFWRECATVADILVLSLLWTVCSIPVCTLGPASAALYDCVVKCVRGSETPVYSRFFRIFRENLKVGALATLMLLPLAAVIWLAYRYLLWGAAAGNSVMYALFIAVCVAAVIPIGAAGWAFPILSRFTFDAPRLVAAAFKFAFTYLPSTLLISAVTVGSALLCAKYVAPLLILPALAALIDSLVIERVFAKYTEKQ